MSQRMDRAAQRAALLELGAAVAEEMRAGQAALSFGAVGDALAALPQASLEIVGLIGREARRRRPDPHLVAALAYICGQALETLRYGVERSDPAAAAMLEAVRGRLVAEARSDKADPTVLLLLTKQFAAARLDIGDELRGVMGDILEEEADAAAETGAGDLDMDRHLADLAHELGHDAFAIHLELSETASSFPIDHRLAMASFMLASGEASVRDAALGWLFDPEPGVAQALCAALSEEALAGRLDGTALRRLVAVRNWLGSDVRPGIDAAVRAARRQGAEPVPPAAQTIEDLRISAFDGAGAASAFALVRTGRHYALASVLFKFGFGVRDAWVSRGLTRAQARAQLDRMADEIELVPVSPATLRRLLASMLAVNAAATPPVFGTVDVVETLGLGTVNPDPLTPEAVVADVLEGGPAVPADVLAESADWPARYGFVAGWFEEDAAVEEALAGRKGQSRARRIDAVLERVVVPRRRRWGEMLAWTALVSADGDDRGVAVRFAAVAAAMLGDAPVAGVPLLRAIAEGTIEARRHRRG